MLEAVSQFESVQNFFIICIIAPIIIGPIMVWHAWVEKR